MDTQQVASFLDDATRAASWLQALGVQNVRRGHRNLVRMAEIGLPLEFVRLLCTHLQHHLPRCSDPDLTLNTLERFLNATRSPLAFGALIERDPETLRTLLQLFDSSEYLGNLLVQDPEAFDLVRMTEGQPVNRDQLIDEMCGEVRHLPDRRAVMATLRRYKRRETLRIAYGDIIRQQRLELVTRQISFLADAICESALLFARQSLQKRRGQPRCPDGRPARFVVLGLGKLGGTELNYSSDIDLIFIYEAEGRTDGEKTTSNSEFFGRLASEFVKLLTEPTELGSAYRVDLRLRPHGEKGPPVNSLEGALHYYDVMGRTWERQAFVKARPVAGDFQLGHELLQMLEPWIYRRYLSRADITGVKALKRKIEHRARRNGTDRTDVKTGFGGIRDIEFVIQFLQLLNGGDLPEVRTGNTLEAMVRLEQAGCLTHQERSILEDSYAFLRKLEHRLQIMFDLQTHALPEDPGELQKLAIRMGYADTSRQPALAAFREDLQKKTLLNRKILDHLLHDAFGDDSQTEPQVDLVLDPAPESSFIQETLQPYGFRDVPAAYRNLMELAQERIPFLSTRRCRHFLASIAPALLRAIGDTPDPDATLVNLSQVSDSLGGKGVLWELFSFNPPSLQLYVRLCSTSPYLSSILTSNPGMLDELMDSLVLNKLPDIDTLWNILTDLCHNAEDLEPILHSFKNAQHLNAGVRDILGKETIRTTTAFLSDVAEVCLRLVVQTHYAQLQRKYGTPSIGRGEQAQPCELVILALGKLGGREPNYHSDLDLVFVYPADGYTRHRQRSRGETTTNQHFFSELAQRIIKQINRLGPYGRLYELDARLRPTGKSGALAVALPELQRYFEQGLGQLWERQSLCRARPIFGSPEAQAAAMQVVRHIIVTPPWTADNAHQIREMRLRMEEGASPHNLKRSAGGTIDIEFLTQMYQLRHARQSPEVLQPGTTEALAALRDAGHLSAEHADYLIQSYAFLRGVEARLRLMNTTARHDLPTNPLERQKLAYLLRADGAEALVEQCRRQMQENRRLFHLLCR